MPFGDFILASRCCAKFHFLIVFAGGLNMCQRLRVIAGRLRCYCFSLRCLRWNIIVFFSPVQNVSFTVSMKTGCCTKLDSNIFGQMWSSELRKVFKDTVHKVLTSQPLSLLYLLPRPVFYVLVLLSNWEMLHLTASEGLLTFKLYLLYFPSATSCRISEKRMKKTRWLNTVWVKVLSHSQQP